MKKRWKVLAVLISLLTLAASMRIVYVSGFLTHNYPAQNARVFTKKGDPLRCDGITYRAGDTSGTRRGVLRPGTNWNTQIEVSNLRIERWHKRATIGIYAGKLRNVTAEGGGADLALGESFTFEGVGTITLLDVDIDWFAFTVGNDKAGDTATYCFEPTPGFNVGDDYKSHYQKQHPDTPTPWPTTPAKQTNRRSSQPTGKGQLTSQTQADHRNKPRAEPATSPPLRIPVSPPTQRKQNR